jgi:hypothetical protein
MDDLNSFLKHFRPDGYTTYVSIIPDGKTTAKTFNGSDRQAIRSWAEEQNDLGENVYFTVNPTPGDLAKKPTKEEIAEIGAVWADIDPRDGEIGEQQRLARLADELHEGQYPPSFIVHSGNGIQPVWLLDCGIESNPENRQAAESLCAKIEAALGAKGTHNCERLLRLPGYVNYPNA